MPIHQEPRTSTKHPEHKIYPFLLRGLAITRPDQVWCADISGIPMRRGFLYLAAIMDRHSRKVLCWRLCQSMDASFCVEAVREALAQYGSPEICNSDQGSQFTSSDLAEVLLDAKVRISMDGHGRRIDNRMIERLVTARLAPPASRRRDGLRYVYSDVANDVSYMRRSHAGGGSGC